MKQNAMLTGKPSKTLLLFAIPMLMGNLLQQLYSIIDSLVVGNFVGPDALAAVGNTAPIVFMITCVSFGISNGASILIGQYYGSGRHEEIKKLVTTSVIYILAVSVVLAVVSMLGSRSLVNFMNTPANILEDSLLYLRIYLCGLIFVFGFNMISAVFRSLGDSKTPLLFLGIASVLNIILDLVFVLMFGWGVMGVAVATVISQFIAFLFQVVLLFKRMEEMGGEVGPGIRGKIDMACMKMLTKLAIPTTGQELLVSFGIFATQILINGFGSDVVAAYTAGEKFNGFVMMPMINICGALTVFSAQNMGAGKPERIVKGYRATITSNLVFAGVMSGIVALFGPVFIKMFVGQNPPADLMAAGESYLLYSIFAFFMMAVLFSAEGVMKGAGDVNYFLFSAITGSVVKVVAGFLLIPYMGYMGVWMGINIGWLVEGILTTGRYFSGKWKTKRFVGSTEKK